MKSLFQYTVLFHEYETTEKGRVYKDSQIIAEPKFVLASSEKEVIFKATREIDEKYAASPDDVQILIRNFQYLLMFLEVPLIWVLIIQLIDHY